VRDRERVAGRGSLPLGVILAGGASRRFGSAKALAEVGGVTIVERVRAALAAVLPEVRIIANEPHLFAELDLPVRPDLLPGAGPMAGVQAALAWAAEEGRPGALCMGCDLPFVSPALLRALLDRAEETGAEVVVPESRGRRGVEPLCAFYSVACRPAVDALLRAGERGMTALLDSSRVDRLPLAEVLQYGDPDVLFLNVNTPRELETAALLAAEHA